MPPRRSRMARGSASTADGALSPCCTDWYRTLAAAKYISWFQEIGLGDRPRVGGKGGSLGELHRAGIKVPPGFVVCTEAFEGFIAGLERHAPLRARIEALAADDLEAMRVAARELRTRIENEPLP